MESVSGAKSKWMNGDYNSSCIWTYQRMYAHTHTHALRIRTQTHTNIYTHTQPDKHICTPQNFKRGHVVGIEFASVVMAAFLTSSFHFSCLGGFMWALMCFVRWSLRMNRWPQPGQTNFFSPVCQRRCRERSSERANCRLHPSILQWNGFSPEKRTNQSAIATSDKWNSSFLNSNSDATLSKLFLFLNIHLWNSFNAKGAKISKGLTALKFQAQSWKNIVAGVLRLCRQIKV